MVRRISKTFTEVELEFMNIIWEHSEVSSLDIQNILKESGRWLSDGAIRKILSILMDKGHLARRRVGRTFYYKAVEQKDQAHKKMVKDLLKRGFGGSASQMVSALLNTNEINKGDLEEIKRLIKKREKEGLK
ncbi:BlaI/MecI/CopY family transcriptional regulator [Candidatus Latescibacterota bacterium]